MTTLRRVLALLVLIMGYAAAESDPLRYGLDRLKATLDGVADVRAGEVRSELEDLERTRQSLERQDARLMTLRTNLAIRRQAQSGRDQEHDARQAAIDRDQQAFDADLANFRMRAQTAQADARAQNAAQAAAKSTAEIESANAWGLRANAVMAALKHEGALLADRKQALDNRRSALADDKETRPPPLSGDTLQAEDVFVDQTTTDLLGQCSTALSRALALHQVAHVPGHRLDDESPDEIANKAGTELFHSLLFGVAVRLMKTEVVANLAERSGLAEVLALVGLDCAGVGVIVTGLDISVDIAQAGVDQRTREVSKNLFLIGDYAAVMKKMIRLKGGAATKDPEYQAMRAEMERLAAGMPASTGGMLLQGLSTSSAAGAAVTAAAAHYVSKGTEEFGATITNHLNNSERQVLGKGAVVFFRESLKHLGDWSGDELTKGSASAVKELMAGSHDGPGNEGK